MKWLKRWRLRKKLRKYPRRMHDDHPDPLFGMWDPSDIKRRKWWQFWRRKRKVTIHGPGDRLRGESNWPLRNPDVVIIDDPEAQ